MADATTTATVEDKTTVATATEPVKPVTGDPEKTYSAEHVQKMHTENANRRKENDDLRGKLATIESEASELREYKLKKEQDAAEAKGEYDKALKLEKEARKEADKRAAEATRGVVMAKAESLAVKAGIKDEALDDLALRPELKDAKLEDLAEIIGKIKESKPHWFADAKAAVDKVADDHKVVKTPDRTAQRSGLDFNKLNADERRSLIREKYGIQV